jgi:predicted nucleic acid-binding protein
MDLVSRGVVSVPFRFAEEGDAVARLLIRYENLPMSFADACPVRMAEQYRRSTVLTLDKDFRVYRKHGRQVIPTIMPNLA